MKKSHKILVLISIIYIVFILLFIGKFDFNPSATIFFQDNYFDGLQQYNYSVPENIVILKQSGYDGQFFYMMALNMFEENIPVTTFRYQRIMYPFLTNTFAFGIESLIPISMLLINLFSIILSTYVLILILKKYDANLNLAYLWAFNIGFIITVTKNLSSPLLFLFILFAFYFTLENKHKTSSLFFTLAILTKEVAVAIILPLILYLTVKKEYKKCAPYFLPLMIFLLWQLILFLKFGQLAMLSSSNLLSLPLTGFINYLSEISLNQSFRDILAYFSVLPILLFAIIQIFVVFRKRNTKISLITFILLAQILMIFSFKNIYSETIDGLGRQAIGLFLFSILYSAEKGESYNPLLIILNLLTSVLFFVYLVILVDPFYFVT
jgi:hypothetical protein